MAAYLGERLEYYDVGVLWLTNAYDYDAGNTYDANAEDDYGGR